MWIICTILAALLQTIRNGLKSQLSSNVSAIGTTFARYILSVPLVLLSLAGLIWFNPEIPYIPNSEMIPDAIITALFQVLGTVAMVQLFKMENYAVGAGLAKSEAIAAALLGVAFFGSELSPLGIFGVTLGFVAVLIMSIQGVLALPSKKNLAMGLFCGISYAISSVFTREAALKSGLLFPLNAVFVVLIAVTFQVITLFIYVRWREPETLKQLLNRPKLTCAVSFISTICSLAWFAAMALMDVAKVKTLGQIEVLFTMIYAYYILKQPPTPREYLGLILIGIAAIAVLQ